MSAVDTYIETETERVERWRTEEFLRVGFDVEVATLLAAEPGVDLHAAIDMVERGWPPLERATYDASRTLRGSAYIGSPQEVAEKILFQHEIFGHQRFLVQFSVGRLPHKTVMRSIELFGTEVAPIVRKELAAAHIP